MSIRVFLILSLVVGAICADPENDLVQKLQKIVESDVVKDEGYAEIHPDAAMTSLELISKYGYVAEDHRVETEDGYILGLHRIPGSLKSPPASGKPAIFLMHGLLGDSSNFLLSGPGRALAYILADAGFDVWLGNARGNTYSRKHVSMTVADKDFWTFSWHEIGKYDLPAMIDYVLETVNQPDLFYVGHSQGGTTFFVMASERPAYQEKIKVMFAVAPATYSGRIPNIFFHILAMLQNKIHLITKLIGMYEFEPTNDFIAELGNLVCGEEAITQPLCHNIVFLIGGFDEKTMNMSIVPIVLGHSPSGASVRQILHYGQLVRSGEFRQFDHGLIENLRIYGSITPPSYDLGSIKTPVYIFYATNDQFVHVRDVHQLYNELGNALGKFRVPDERFGHLEFIFGMQVKEFVYDKILGLLTRHV